MRYIELFEDAEIVGYWEVEQRGDVRFWKPVWTTNPPNDALFPFKRHSNAPWGTSLIKRYQAYDILPNRSKKELSLEEKRLLAGLYDALKLRSERDKIAPEDFQQLLDNASAAVLAKSGLGQQLRKVNKQKVYIITPPSSSGVAHMFAKELQSRIKVPNENMMLDHFTKRDVLDVISDIEAVDHPRVSGTDKDIILDRIYGSYNKREDTTFKVKDLDQGHRSRLHSAGVSFLDVAKEFNIPGNRVPYLLVVDDNVQSGFTAKDVVKVFMDATGITPSNVYSLAMFQYP